MPLNLKEILVVHHTHTDWGYTTHPNSLKKLHHKYIEDAIHLCQKHSDQPCDQKYRWTCESACVVDEFLQNSSTSLIQQFLDLVNQGLIEVTAVPLCPAPNNTRQTIRAALEITKNLHQRYGLACEVAMFCDINGLPQPWVDELSDIGVKYLAMAMNYYAGGGMTRYQAFNYESQSGNKLLTWHGQHYNMGSFWGINHDVFDMNHVVPERLKELEENAYSYDKLLLQVTNIPSDNMSPHENLLGYIRKYNDLAKSQGWPPMRTATLWEWFAYLEKSSISPPYLNGDWSDWWASYLANSPRQVATARETDRRLMLSSRWLACLKDKNRKTQFEKHLLKIRQSLYLVNEHVYGSAGSSASPYGNASLASEAFQLNLSYSTLYEATSLLQDIVRIYGTEHGLAISVLDTELEEFDPNWTSVVNQSYSNQIKNIDVWDVPESHGLVPLKECSDQNHQFRRGAKDNWQYVGNRFIQVARNNIDGECVVSSAQKNISVFKAMDQERFGSVVVEVPKGNNRQSWFPDGSGPQVQWATDSWPRDSKWLRCRTEFIRPNHPDTLDIQDNFKALTIQSAYNGEINLQVSTSITLHDILPVMDIEYVLSLSETDIPFSIYIPFPFSLSPSQCSAEIGGCSITPFKQQLPGSCKNWLTVHKGVHFADDPRESSVFWTSWDAPLVMFEEICPCPPKTQSVLTNAHIYSWAINNYWKTNVVSHHSGEYRFRYQIAVWDKIIEENELNTFLSKRSPPSSLKTQTNRIV